MASYVILIKYTHEGACLDSCLDVSLIFKYGTPANAAVVEQVRTKMGCSANEAISSLVHAFRSLELRSRFDGGCDGPFLIHTPGDLSRDEIDLLLQDKETLAKIRQGGI